jgi:hypothetical protein
MHDSTPVATEDADSENCHQTARHRFEIILLFAFGRSRPHDSMKPAQIGCVESDERAQAAATRALRSPVMSFSMGSVAPVHGQRRIAGRGFDALHLDHGRIAAGRRSGAGADAA